MKGVIVMEISATVKFLVKNMVSGKVTYLQVVKKHPELKEQIDAYIGEQGFAVDKTV